MLNLNDKVKILRFLKGATLVEVGQQYVKNELSIHRIALNSMCPGFPPWWALRNHRTMDTVHFPSWFITCLLPF
jgi:hypothetical protein